MIIYLRASMNFERYIANRISSAGDSGFTKLIVKIAIAAVALSMTVMIITTNVITGFKNQISNKVFDFWGHIHVSDGNPGDTFEAAPFEFDSLLVNEIKGIEAITYQRPPRLGSPEIEMPTRISKGGIRSVDPYIVASGILTDNKLFEAVLLKGISESLDSNRVKQFLKKGSFLTLNQDSPSREMLISTITAERMGFGVGSKVIVNFIVEGEPYKRAYRVVGIYKTGLGEYDRRFAIVDMRTLQEVLGWSSNQVGGLEIHAEHWSDMEVLSDYIFFEKLPGNLYSKSVKQKFYQIFEWLELQNINERVLILLMILVAMINMITALLIFVLERTKMIGVLKALGAKNWSIRKIFLYNATRIILTGIALGNLLAILICGIQKYTGIMKLTEEDYYLDKVPIEFNLWTMLLINVGTIVLVLLVMILPTRIVSSISPVKTIQFK